MLCNLTLTVFAISLHINLALKHSANPKTRILSSEF